MITDLNGLTLNNGVLINGVANFYTDTKPVEREDGSLLKIGDRWINPSTGVEGFFNGTYWLSSLVNTSVVAATISAFTASTFGNIPFNKQSFFSTITLSVQSEYSTADISNYYNLQVGVTNSFNSYSTNYFLAVNLQNPITTRTNIDYEVNTVRPTTPTGEGGLTLGHGWNALRVQYQKTGSPSNISASLIVRSREVL